MLSIIGFSWLMYSQLHNFMDTENGFFRDFDFSGVMSPIRDYLDDTNHLLTYLTNIGVGIRNIFLQLPPLILYFVLVAMILTIVSFFIRLVFDVI